MENVEKIPFDLFYVLQINKLMKLELTEYRSFLINCFKGSKSFDYHRLKAEQKTF